MENDMENTDKFVPAYTGGINHQISFQTLHCSDQIQNENNTTTISAKAEDCESQEQSEISYQPGKSQKNITNESKLSENTKKESTSSLYQDTFLLMPQFQDKDNKSQQIKDFSDIHYIENTGSITKSLKAPKIMDSKYELSDNSINNSVVFAQSLYKESNINVVDDWTDRREGTSSSLNGECSDSNISKLSSDNNNNASSESPTVSPSSSHLRPLTVCTTLPTEMSGSLASPYVQFDPLCPKSPLIVNFPKDMNEEEIVKNKEMILKIFHNTMNKAAKEKANKANIVENKDRSSVENTSYKMPPFPLQDPPKSRIKRQISVESNETRGGSEKSPIKRHQVGDTDSSTCRSETMSISFNEYDDVFQESSTEYQKSTFAQNVDEISKTEDRKIQNHLYRCSKENHFLCEEQKKSTNIPERKQVISSSSLVDGSDFLSENNYNQPSVSKNLDMIQDPVLLNSSYPLMSTPKESYMHGSSNDIPKHKLFSPRKHDDSKTSDLSSSYQGYSDYFEQEMVRFDHRDEHLYSIPTASISVHSNNHVTEKGFVFPEKATIKEPILFSPRVVHPDIRPRFPISNRMPNCSLNSAGKGQVVKNYNEFRVPKTPTEIDDSFRKQRVTYRSQSDIDHSPSKLDTELQKQFDDITYHRTFSDPLGRRPHEKNIIYENRIKANIMSPEKERDHLMFYDANFVKNKSLLESKLRYQSEFPTSNTDNYMAYAINPEGVRRHLLDEFDSKQTYGKAPLSSPRKKTTKPKQIIDEHLANRLLRTTNFTIDDIRNFNERSTTSNESSDEEENEEQFRKALIGVSMESILAKSSENLNFHSVTIDKQRNNSFSYRNRKYKGEEIDIKVSCTDLSEKVKELKESLKDSEHNQSSCTCTQIENQILQMAKDAYKHLRNQNHSSKSFQQFEIELQETNSKIYDSIKLLSSMKSMCKHGRTITSITTGSVVFSLLCPTVRSMDTLWAMHRSQVLEQELNEDFITEELKQRYPNMQIYLKVSISVKEFREKRKRLAKYEQSKRHELSISRSDSDISLLLEEQESFNKSKYGTIPSISLLYAGSHSAPSSQLSSPIGWRHRSPRSPASPNCWSPGSPMDKERKFLFPPVERQAFKEINTFDETPRSPTLRKLKDLDLNLSPKTSPKRKTFSEPMPWDEENVFLDTNSPKRKNFGDQK